MRKLLFLFIFLPILAHAEGPNFRNKETFTQQEFDNVYGDLRQKVNSSLLTTNTSGQVLVGQGNGANPVWQSAVAARYSSNAANTIANNNSEIVDFEDKEYDTHNAVVVGSNTWTFTAPVNGYYRVTSLVTYAAEVYAINDRVYLALKKNGSEENFLCSSTIQTTTSIVSVCNGSTITNLSAGGTISVNANNNGGGTHTYSNNSNRMWVEIELIK